MYSFSSCIQDDDNTEVTDLRGYIKENMAVNTKPGEKLQLESEDITELQEIMHSKVIQVSVKPM